jgi:hypothetical protein
MAHLNGALARETSRYVVSGTVARQRLQTARQAGHDGFRTPTTPTYGTQCKAAPIQDGKVCFVNDTTLYYVDPGNVQGQAAAVTYQPPSGQRNYPRANATRINKQIAASGGTAKAVSWNTPDKRAYAAGADSDRQFYEQVLGLTQSHPQDHQQRLQRYLGITALFVRPLSRLTRRPPRFASQLPPVICESGQLARPAWRSAGGGAPMSGGGPSWAALR